jgi:hypothetical protein
MGVMETMGEDDNLYIFTAGRVRMYALLTFEEYRSLQWLTFDEVVTKITKHFNKAVHVRQQG